MVSYFWMILFRSSEFSKSRESDITALRSSPAVSQRLFGFGLFCATPLMETLTRSRPPRTISSSISSQVALSKSMLPERERSSFFYQFSVFPSFSNIKKSSTSLPIIGLASVAFALMFHEENLEDASFRGGTPCLEGYEQMPAGFIAVFQALVQASPCAESLPEVGAAPYPKSFSFS